MTATLPALYWPTDPDAQPDWVTDVPLRIEEGAPVGPPIEPDPDPDIVEHPDDGEVLHEPIEIPSDE